jgi:hypothetical protein
MCTYLQKKAEAKRRGIPFTLTEEQWDFLIKIKEDSRTKCAYTGQTFIFKQNHPQCASLERMEDRVEFKDGKWTGGYSFCNVVWTTLLSNQVKDEFIDKKEGNIKKAPQHKVIVLNSMNKRLVGDWKHTLWFNQIGRNASEDLILQSIEDENFPVPTENNETSYDTQDYLEEEQPEMQEQTKDSTTTEVTHNNNYKLDTKVLKDLFVATYYQHLVNHSIKQQIEFNISLAQFKQILLKKTCSLSGDVLQYTQETSTQPKLLMKEPELGYVTGNVLLVSGKTLSIVNELRSTFGDKLSDVTKILTMLNKV